VMNEVIKEHVNFKAGANRKDDSVDTLARLARYLPKDISCPQTEQEKQTAAWDLLKQKQLSERQFMYRDPEVQSKPETPGLWKTDGYDRQEIIVPAPTHWEGMPILKYPEESIFGT